MIWTTLKIEAERSYETPVYSIKLILETGQESPDGEWKRISFLCLNSAADGLGREHHAPFALPSD